jgi:hypothetical protein
MHIQLDTLGGIAGDMFIAAVLDACPELTADTLAAIDATGIPSSWKISLAEHHDHTLCGKRLAVSVPGDAGHGAHEPYREIVRRLNDAPLAPRVREKAIAIFDRLAEAEGEVHGVPRDDVTFHEVGAWDSIADIVGAAFLLDALDPVSWSVSAIPLGSGRIATAHGPLPVPAPASAKLLRGFKLIDDGIEGERVTPTGAAILRYLRDTAGAPSNPAARPMELNRIGTGFGTRVLPGISNVLRILVFDEAAADRQQDRIGVICFEIDDQTAEDLAVGIDSLRLLDGVLDVLQVSAVGKKGRMVFQVQVLCLQERLDEVIDACFAETTTIGLRWSIIARTKLQREMATIDTAGQSTAVKLVRRPKGRPSAKADVESLRTCDGLRERQQRRRDAEQQALTDRASTESCRNK